MSGPNPNDAWQVEVNGQVYPASFSELADWIAEGALLPDDKVRRGNLRWIEARRVPTLTPFFNAKASGLPPPAIVVSTTDASEVPAANVTAVSSVTIQDIALPVITPASNTNFVSAPIAQAVQFVDPNVCATHSDRPAKYVCTSCERASCRDCVKSFGSSVTVCSVCGGMCKAKTELEDRRRKEEFRAASITSGFGFGDFGEAIAYPFKFKVSLFFGSLMFMFFSIGRGASSFGGIYMIVASIFAYMLSNMLAFGVLANTIESFAHGKIGGNFMPSFEDFELWDDVIHPFFLSIGVYISAFGPFLAVFLLGSYLVLNSVSSEMDTVKSNLEQTPGTPYYNVRDTLDQSKDVNSVLKNSERINQEHLNSQDDIENGKQPAAIDQEEENFRRVNNMIAESKKKELESVVGKSPETRERESAAFVAGLLKLAAPIMVIGLITFLWGLFFFPAACMVAGYTRSFVATINPLVGLDTIKRMGSDYVKILFMMLLLGIAFVIVSVIIGAVFAAFNLPGVGNLPANALSSIVWFYLAIVFSCILGFAVFKASDRLHLID